MFKIALPLVVILAWQSPVLVPRPPSNPGQVRPGVVNDWKARLRSAGDALRAGNWDKGEQIADSVLREMRQRVSGGEGTASLLAVGLLYRAIGQAAAGEIRAAAWDFGAAQIFYPAYAKVDLTPFGLAGAALEGWRYDGSVPAAPEQLPNMASAVVPPKKIRGDVPNYPSAKRFACVDGPIVVQTIINEQGQLEYPYLLSSVDPILGLAALDAVRDWQFRPAELDGKPVRVYYNLTVNFKLPYCPSS